MDWTEGPGVYKKFLDWEETVKFIMGMPFNSEHKHLRANFLMHWLDQNTRNYVKWNETYLKDPKEVMDTIKTWWKLKSNKITTFTQPRILKQDSLSLLEFIKNAIRLVNHCNYPGNAWNRLLRDIIVSGITLPEAYSNQLYKEHVPT